MIYIKRFLYILFMVAFTIFGCILFFTFVATYPIVAMVDYIVHGELTTDYIIKVCEWWDDVSNKFNPE